MNATPVPAKSRWLGITLRTALLSWLVAIVTLLLFVVALLPQQKRTFLEALRSKAYGVTVSLRDVAAGAVVNEDYSSVVDHCTEMLKGDPAIDYIVITRNDGFSLVHDRGAWNSKTLGAAWRPTPRTPAGRIETVDLFNRRVYAYSQPFDYSGIEWGWIHVGLSLDAYDRNIAGLYQQTALLAVVCVLFSLGVSMVYAKRLVRPILSLQQIVQRVAGGDLSARATVERTDELGHLAASVNTMTEALLRRDRILQEANESLEQRVHARTRELQDQVVARERANRDLADAQRRLMQLSREAGMAEVATGVLHNVGNVLNKTAPTCPAT
jgi:methyl-accepting chemotaxis protein